MRTQYPQKLNDLTGMLGEYIIGPFFIDGNLNGVKYLQVLQNQIMPTVQQLINFGDIW